MKKMNPVVHFEMPAEDRQRMADFYSKTFGWKMNMMGEEMGNYIVVQTSEAADEKGTPKMPGMINGGFYTKTKEMPTQYPSVVIAVDDISASIKDIKDNGGTVQGEPMDIPGVGAYVSFIDTEGNKISILQPVAM